MSQLAYLAPTIPVEAAKALAAPARGRCPAAPTCWCSSAPGGSKPEVIVDLKRMPGLIGIREEGGGFVIGAATPAP